MRRTAKEFLNDFRQRLIENQPPIDFKNPQKGFPGWWEDDTVQEMMDAYASEVLREELISILNFISDEKSPYAVCYGSKTRFATNDKDLTTEVIVDEYLKTK
jgi:hypothetical protein